MAILAWQPKITGRSTIRHKSVRSGVRPALQIE